VLKVLLGVFAKLISHQFKKIMQQNNSDELEKYEVDKGDRKYQFWKRDPLAIPLTFEAIFLQQLEYINNNPVKENWMYADFPKNYKRSSVSFYETGIDEFGTLNDYRF
jgi:putative transposase